MSTPFTSFRSFLFGLNSCRGELCCLFLILDSCPGGDNASNSRTVGDIVGGAFSPDGEMMICEVEGTVRGDTAGFEEFLIALMSGCEPWGV